MWVLRELVRLLQRVFVAVVIAVIVAELLTTMSSRDWAHELQICLILVGGLVVALGAMGGGSMYQRDADYWDRRGLRVLARMAPARTAGPQLAPGAVLFLSGAATIALGFAVSAL